MAYKYKALDQSGKKVSGVIYGKSKKKALRELSIKNLTVISIEEYKEKDLDRFEHIKGFFKFKKSLNNEEKIILNLQFANLLSANVSIIEALDIITAHTRNKFIKSALKEVKRDIEKGLSIYEAFEKSGIFDELTVNMIKAGEESSRLAEIFYKLSEFSEKQFRMSQNIKSIIAYPIILVVMGLFLTIITMGFVFPKFIDVFKTQGISSLPMITKVVASASSFFVKYWLFIFVLFLIALYFMKAFFYSEKGKYFLSKAMIKIPFIRDIIAKNEFSKFLYSMHLLLSSGVDIIDSITYASGTLRNVVYRNYIEGIKLELKKGKSFPELLKDSPYMPDMAVRLISIGDQTGEFESFLQKAANYMELMFSYQMKKILVLLEPLLLIILGIIIGSLMASFILPLFRMIKIRH